MLVFRFGDLRVLYVIDMVILGGSVDKFVL